MSCAAAGPAASASAAAMRDLAVSRLLCRNIRHPRFALNVERRRKKRKLSGGPVSGL